MKCPFCRQATTEVYNSRSTKFTSQIWRRRRCLSCSKTFTTYEWADLSFLKVKRSVAIKPVPYNRAIVFYSIYEAYLDIPHKESTVDAVTETVEAKLLDLRSDFIKGSQISQAVLSTLKPLSTPAFLRYLSQHADLSSAKQLKRALRS